MFWSDSVSVQKLRLKSLCMLLISLLLFCLCYEHKPRSASWDLRRHIEGSWSAQPMIGQLQICHSGVRTNLSWRHLRISKCRERLLLNPFICFTTDSTIQKKEKKNVLNPFTENFIYQVRLTFITGEEMSWYGESPDQDRYCHKLSYLPSILLRAHLSFLKISFSSICNLSVCFPY